MPACQDMSLWEEGLHWVESPELAVVEEWQTINKLMIIISQKMIIIIVTAVETSNLTINKLVQRRFHMWFEVIKWQ
jgi:hypothetical protein